MGRPSISHKFIVAAHEPRMGYPSVFHEQRMDRPWVVDGSSMGSACVARGSPTRPHASPMGRSWDLVASHGPHMGRPYVSHGHLCHGFMT